MTVTTFITGFWDNSLLFWVSDWDISHWFWAFIFLSFVIIFKMLFKRTIQLKSLATIRKRALKRFDTFWTVIKTWIFDIRFKWIKFRVNRDMSRRLVCIWAQTQNIVNFWDIIFDIKSWLFAFAYKWINFRTKWDINWRL